MSLFQIPEMIEYARTDTHYLMYIYHRMKKELLDKGNDQKNLLRAVYEQSNDLCEWCRNVKITILIFFTLILGKTIFSKPLISHLPLLERSKVNLNARQTFAFKEIYLW